VNAFEITHDDATWKSDAFKTDMNYLKLELRLNVFALEYIRRYVGGVGVGYGRKVSLQCGVLWRQGVVNEASGPGSHPALVASKSASTKEGGWVGYEEYGEHTVFMQPMRSLGTKVKMLQTNLVAYHSSYSTVYHSLTLLFGGWDIK